MGLWKSSREQFDAWSRRYDRSVLQRIFFRPSHDRVLAEVAIPRAASILDVGCGTCLFGCRILRERPDVQWVGLDQSERMLERAAANLAAFGDRARLVWGDSQRMPFATSAFDLVVCTHSFHHYLDQAKAIGEMHRVLAPGGRLALVDGDRDGYWGWMIFDGVVTTVEGNVHHCSAGEFRRLLLAAGFTAIRQTRGGRLAPFLLTTATAKAEEGRLAA